MTNKKISTGNSSLVSKAMIKALLCHGDNSDSRYDNSKRKVKKRKPTHLKLNK